MIVIWMVSGWLAGVPTEIEGADELVVSWGKKLKCVVRCGVGGGVGERGRLPKSFIH